MWTRRSALAAGAALAACAPRQRIGADSPPPNDARFAAIEASIGGRVGVFALNTASGAVLAHRPNERFAMCSTFKWLLAAQMLWTGQQQADFMHAPVLFRRADLLEYAPAARARLGEAEIGDMRVGEMCEAIVVLSDNTCANALLEGAAMGPEGFTRFLRANGDGVTRLDRYETELNIVPPGDERDTTTPAAMTRTLQRFLLGHSESGGRPTLNQASRERLIGWMVQSPTGRERLRAGLPSDWRAGDKTGTWNGEHNASNDVAIAWPPGRAPILIACYLSRSEADAAARNAAHAEIARIIADTWS